MLVLLLVLVAEPVHAEDEPWALLKKGGHVVLVRHAQTSSGVGDPPGMRLDDCATQRNLSEVGRAQARRIREEFRQFRVPVDEVLSSEWCRCVETAGLAFGGTADVWPALNNLFGRPERQAGQVHAMQTLVGGWRGPGALVLVSHGSTIAALTGINPDTAEMVIVTPQGDGRFAGAGRLLVP